jgi:hypothetical protein
MFLTIARCVCVRGEQRILFNMETHPSDKARSDKLAIILAFRFYVLAEQHQQHLWSRSVSCSANNGEFLLGHGKSFLRGNISWTRIPPFPLGYHGGHISHMQADWNKQGLWSANWSQLIHQLCMCKSKQKIHKLCLCVDKLKYAELLC